jgi:hypothetical protein
VHGDRRHVRATIRAGASGYLIKDDDADKLAGAIRAVHTGHLALTTELITLINDDPPELSPQELHVLYLYGTAAPSPPPPAASASPSPPSAPTSTASAPNGPPPTNPSTTSAPSSTNTPTPTHPPDRRKHTHEPTTGEQSG